MKISPEMTSWLRQPAAERYIKDQQKLVAAALETLLGTCSCSEDCRVRELWARWRTLTDQTQALVNARKESATEEDD